MCFISKKGNDLNANTFKYFSFYIKERIKVIIYHGKQNILS